MNETGEEFLNQENIDSNEKSEFKKQSLHVLEELGYLKMQDEIAVVEIEKLKNFRYRDYKSKRDVSPKLRNEYGNNTTNLFVNLFEDKEVLVRGREGEGLVPLVYIPKDEEEAFGISAIRKSKAALGLWEIGQRKGSKFWNSEYPFNNTSNELASSFEVAVPHFIYNRGNGSRDEHGALWVDKVVGKPEGGRQKISGAWFKRNGLQGPTDSRFDGSPRRVVETNGSFWEKYDLLTVDDIPEINANKSEHPITSDTGDVYIGGKQIHLGSAYQGMKAIKIAPEQYVVINPETESPELVFSTIINSENVRDCSVVGFELDRKRRKRVYVPEYAHWRSVPDQLGSAQAYIYSGEKKRRVKIDLSSGLDDLMRFKGSLGDSMSDNLTQISLKDQIGFMIISKRLSEQGDNRALELLRLTGAEGAQAISDSLYEGGVDSRMLDIVSLEQSELVQLMEKYSSLRESASGLIGAMRAKLDQAGELDITKNVLLERLHQSFKFRTADFLTISTQGHLELAVEHMDALGKGMSKVKTVIEGKSPFKFDYMPDVNSASESGRYTFADGSTLSLTVRPEKTENAQARFSITYKNAEGIRVNVRIDHDEYGISLDVTTRGSELHGALDELGKSHHTQVPFEKSLSNEQDFAETLKSIPLMLGWNST